MQLILLRTQKPETADANEDKMEEETPAAHDRSNKGKEKASPSGPSFPTITETLSLTSGDGGNSSTSSGSATSDPAQMLFIRLQPVLPQLLTHRDEDSQLLTLKILYSLLPSLTYANILSFLEPLLLTFAVHGNDKLREAYYDIVVFLYDKSYELKGSDLLREYLLRGILHPYQCLILIGINRYFVVLVAGLTDPSKEIREKLLAFWDDPTRLDYDSITRLKQTITFASPSFIMCK